MIKSRMKPGVDKEKLGKIAVQNFTKSLTAFNMTPLSDI